MQCQPTLWVGFWRSVYNIPCKDLELNVGQFPDFGSSRLFPSLVLHIYSLSLSLPLSRWTSDAYRQSKNTPKIPPFVMIANRSVMIQNIESVLERGEKIELLVDKTDRLNQQAFKFEASSRNLRKAMYWKQMRCRIFLGVGVLILLYLFAASACGGVTFPRCRAS